LVRHDDVVHPDVPSQLWVCTSCGHLFGPMAMEQCELCAAPASEHDCYQ
jgi:rubrerythrin